MLEFVQAQKERLLLLQTPYPEVIDDLIKQGKVVGSRVDFDAAFSVASSSWS
jgi:hypothetical protein